MTKLFLSCEHGGNQIPPIYQHLFRNAGDLLNTHRGFDNGALELFNALKNNGVHFSVYSETSRLLVDLNRSLHKRSLFSEFTKTLDSSVKTEILNSYYHPFRDAFFSETKNVVEKNDNIFHVSVHAFTPVLNGVVRKADIGLLYNPAHGVEKRIAVMWKTKLEKVFPDFVIRYNYPYLGKTDGHVAPLRKAFGNRYAGLEFELNSKHAGNMEVINGIALTYKKITDNDLFLGTP